MPDALAQPLQRWHDFYLLVGGAAATLAGLVFVAISLGSRLITQQSVPALRVFVTPTIIHFIYVLVIATVVVTPAVRRTPLGILLVLVGLLSFGRVLGTIPFLRRQRGENVLDAQDWAWYVAVPSAAYLLFVATGIALLRGTGRALEELALASIMLLVNGIRNAWDMVVWFAVKVESPPER